MPSFKALSLVASVSFAALSAAAPTAAVAKVSLFRRGDLLKPLEQILIKATDRLTPICDNLIRVTKPDVGVPPDAELLKPDSGRLKVDVRDVDYRQPDFDEEDGLATDGGLLAFDKDDSPDPVDQNFGFGYTSVDASPEDTPSLDYSGLSGYPSVNALPEDTPSLDYSGLSDPEDDTSGPDLRGDDDVPSYLPPVGDDDRRVSNLLSAGYPTLKPSVAERVQSKPSVPSPARTPARQSAVDDVQLAGIIKDIKVVLNTTITEIKSLLAKPVDGAAIDAGDSMSVEDLAKLLGSIVTVTFTAVRAVLKVVDMLSTSIIPDLLQIGSLMVDLISLIINVCDGLVTRLLSQLLPSISTIIDVITDLNIDGLLEILGLKNLF